jgi:hypothetical protein
MYTFSNEEDLEPLVCMPLWNPPATLPTTTNKHKPPDGNHPPPPHRPNPRKRRPSPPRHPNPSPRAASPAAPTTPARPTAPRTSAHTSSPSWTPSSGASPPGARKIDAATLPPPDEYFFPRERIARGVPDFHELRWVNWRPNGAHVAFSPVSPIRGRDAVRLFGVGKRRWGVWD